MLIKFEVPDSSAQALMEFTGTRVGSKAYHLAADRYQGVVEHVEFLNGEVDRLQEIIALQRQVIDGARNAAALLLERVGQDDMFIDSFRPVAAAKRR
jgi:hypothetical protein